MQNKRLFITESNWVYACLLDWNLNLQRNVLFKTYKPREFTQFLKKSTYLNYLQDEKLLMTPVFENNYIPPTPCETAEGMKSWMMDFLLLEIVNFFRNNKQMIFKNCTDFRVFSHCQRFYLFQYDTSTRTCHSYYHERCISYLGPFHSRWHFGLFRNHHGSPHLPPANGPSPISFWPLGRRLQHCPSTKGGGDEKSSRNDQSNKQEERSVFAVCGRSEEDVSVYLSDDEEDDFEFFILFWY